jgi:hypothetical protein
MKRGYSSAHAGGYNGFGLIVWAIIVTLIVLFIGGAMTGCSSPTQVEEECVYRADLEAWVGPGCDGEETAEHRNFWLALSVLLAFVSLAASAGRKR